MGVRVRRGSEAEGETVPSKWTDEAAEEGLGTLIGTLIGEVAVFRVLLGRGGFGEVLRERAAERLGELLRCL